MATKVVNVSILPNEVESILVNQHALGDVIHVESIEYEGKKVVVMVFEKYYIRSSNRAALTVIADNTSGVTKVSAVATGSSEGFIFKFDWGAADDYAQTVVDLLKEVEI